MNKIELKPSLQLTVFLLFIHLGAVLAVCFIHLFWWLKLILATICLINLTFMLWRYVFLRSKNSIIKIYQDFDGQWYLLNRTKQKLRVRLCEDTVITRFLIILNFSLMDKKKKVSVLLFPDILLTEEFRRLRVSLFSTK